MSSWARVGVKCVCIKKDVWRSVRTEKQNPGPTYNEECVIVAIQERNWGLELKVAGYDCWYLVGRFRPLITQEDDVAMFREWLVVNNVEEEV